MYRVEAPSINSSLQDNLENEVSNLGNALYEEIARFATETWKNCYEGKTEITRKALSPLKTMHDKLIDLSFVEPRVTSIASLISTALGSIPSRGPITGATLLMLQGLVSLLRTPAEIVAHGQKILDGQNAGDVLSVISARLPESPFVEDSLQPDAQIPPILPSAPVLESCGLW